MGIKTSVNHLGTATVDSEKPPHHMGIKTVKDESLSFIMFSEKPPHHMGIKTFACTLLS